MSDEDYEKIRALYLSGAYTCKSLGERFGVTSAYIAQLMKAEDSDELRAVKLQHKRKGTKSVSAKLDESKVKEIRRVREVEGLTYRKLATMFGVSAGTVQDIVKRKKWSWVE